MNNHCDGEHRFFVATTGTASNKVWAMMVCTACGEAILKEFPIEGSDLNQVPVYFNRTTGELVTQ